MSELAQPIPIRSGSYKGSEDSAYSSTLLDFLIFLLPAIQFLTFQLVGTVYLSDLITIGLFLFLLGQKGEFARLRAPLPKRLLKLAALWFAAQVFTDIYRHTTFHDLARGWAKILLTIMTLAVFYLVLQGRPREIVIYGWGLVVGELLTYFFNPIEYAAQYPWEFGWGPPVTLAVFLLASDRKYRSLLLPILIGLVNFVLGFRSMGAVCLLATVYLVLRIAWVKRTSQWSGPTIKRVLAVFLVLGACGWGLSTAFANAAKAGLLGSAVQQKYDFQSSGEYGLLLGGRSEILLGAMAIRESPWIGWGSWAKNYDLVVEYEELMLALGYEPAAIQRGYGIGLDSENDYLIGAHSHLFGAWVEAGILGTFLWGWLFWISSRCLSRLYTDSTSTIVPLAVFCTLWLMWHILFEPYGGYERFSTLYYVVVVMSFVRSSPNSQQKVAS